MKALAFIQTLVLLLVFDLCFAQRSVEPAQWHFGLMSQHFVVTEYTSVEFRKIRPLRTSFGLQAGKNLGEHWGIGFNADVRYQEGTYLLIIGPNLPSPFSDRAAFEARRYFGNADLSARYYLQGKQSPARIYFQLGLGTQIHYWESQRLRPADQNEFNEPVIKYFNYQGASLIGGAGFQYRFARRWQAEATMLLRWVDKNRLDYGLQLSLGRVLLVKKT